VCEQVVCRPASVLASSDGNYTGEHGVQFRRRADRAFVEDAAAARRQADAARTRSEAKERLAAALREYAQTLPRNTIGAALQRDADATAREVEICAQLCRTYDAEARRAEAQAEASLARAAVDQAHT